MDKIVSSVNHEGIIYIFSEKGHVYEMRRGFDGKIEFRLIHRIEIH